MSKRRVRIVSAAAFYVSRKENAELAFSDKEFYWTGIRGSEHYPEFYLREQRVARREGKLEVRRWGHLVAEPDNPYDCFAVAVHVDSVKIGNVSASIAEYLQWYVNHFAAQNVELRVPVRIEMAKTGKYYFDPEFEENAHHRDVVLGGYVALPTLSVLDAQSSKEEAEEQLMWIWNVMPQELKNTLTDTFLAENHELMQYLRARRFRAPLAAIPNSSDPEALPPMIQGFFHDRRREVRSERQRERVAQMQEQLRIKEEARNEREARQSAREEAIAQMLQGGASITATMKHHGTTRSTIGRIASEHGIDLGNTSSGLNAANLAASQGRVERCIAAAELADSGVSPIEVARRLTLGRSTAPNMISDGRFYLDPHRNTTRLARAIDAALDQASLEGLSKSIRRRAMSDARVLRSMHPTLLPEQ